MGSCSTGAVAPVLQQGALRSELADVRAALWLLSGCIGCVTDRELQMIQRDNMTKRVSFYRCFPSIRRARRWRELLAQAAIQNAELDMEERAIFLELQCAAYIPRRLLDGACRDLRELYDVRRVEILPPFSRGGSGQGGAGGADAALCGAGFLVSGLFGGKPMVLGGGQAHGAASGQWEEGSGGLYPGGTAVFGGPVWAAGLH